MLEERELDRLELRLSLEAIHDRYGYDFRRYEPETMGRRMAAAAAKVGAKSLGELRQRLLQDPAVFPLVLDLLTVRVTEMFRDPPFYRVFREVVVPALRSYPRLKVWHAGCASGEEVYATTILLTEGGLYERAQIYATDVSHAAVEQAREGVYGEEALARFADNYRAAGGERSLGDYFARAYGGVAVLPALRKNVHFFQHDLVTDYSPGQMQLIFCRNVLIYFGHELRARAYSLFADSLGRAGFLCLGASEALPVAERAHYHDLSAGARIYRRSAA